MYMRVFQIIKHIWQSIVNKHNSAAQVFVSNAGSNRQSDVITILCEPASVGSKERIPGSGSLNPTKMAQQFAQLSTRFTLGIGPQPSTAFMLQMIQTALQSSFWPNKSHRSEDRALSVTGNECGIKALLLQTTKPAIGCHERLLLNIQMSNDLTVYPVHQIEQTAILVKVGRIINNIAYCGVVICLGRRLFKPVANKVTQCANAIAGNLVKLSNGVAFLNPQLKPVLTTVDPIVASLPDKGASALKTLEALFGQSRSAVMSN
jgi:hypothetical protein